jgi:Zn-finger nucleic acid-binding protein
MVCPRDRIALSKLVVEGVEIERCSVCGGTWLDKGELEAIGEHMPVAPGVEADESTVDRAYKVAQERQQGPLECPRCGSEMDKHEYAFASQVLVDSCPKGHGDWLDKGELAALERFYEREKDEAREGSGFLAWLRSL